jgi:hypothetical protein
VGEAPKRDSIAGGGVRCRKLKTVNGDVSSQSELHSAPMSNPFDDANAAADGLEFQDFSHARSGKPRDSLGDMSPAIGSEPFAAHSGTAGGIGSGAVGAGGGFIDGDDSSAAPAHPEQASSFSFWHVRYYATWFNVDTADVAARIAFSSVPLSDKFFDKLNRNPDLYGPLWISSTVVFMLAATGNFAEWLSFASQRGMQAAVATHSFTYDFTKVTFGATIVYGYASLIPLLVYFALRYAGARTSLVDILCLYGYSLFIYVPASILCIPPSSVVQWIFVAVAALASTTFLVRSLRYAVLRDQCDQRIGSTVISAAALLSVAFAVTLKLFLFQNADFAELILPSDASALAATSASPAATDAAAAGTDADTASGALQTLAQSVAGAASTVAASIMEATTLSSK